MPENIENSNNCESFEIWRIPKKSFTTKMLENLGYGILHGTLKKKENCFGSRNVIKVSYLYFIP